MLHLSWHFFFLNNAEEELKSVCVCMFVIKRDFVTLSGGMFSLCFYTC